VTVRRLARREFRESLRNYWFWVNSGVFLAGGVLLVLFGQADVTVLGYRGVARSLAGLMQLALFIVPLMALFPTAAVLAGEREVGTLDYLLAQPVDRAEVYAGKWLGVAAAVLASVLGGLAVVGGIAVGRGMPALLLAELSGLAVLLALTFVSLGLWISASTSTQGRATSLGLTAWLFLLALGSLGLMGAFVGWGIAPAVLETWAFLNPVEAFRMAMITILDPEMQMLGPVGADLADRLGSGGLVAASLASLLAWSGGAYWAGRRTFRAPVRGADGAHGPGRDAGAAGTLLLAVAALGCGGGEEEIRPPEIEYGEETCDQCSMIVSDPRFAAALAIRTPEGRLRRPVFDDLGGPFLYLEEHPGIEPVGWWVHDCRTGEWIPAREALFVRSPRIRSPMAHGLLACGDRARADSVARDRDGEVLEWEQVRALARDGAFDVRGRTGKERRRR
jgi:ABC-type transport system involved in multi-copper enzyme maturation permease subunit